MRPHLGRVRRGPWRLATSAAVGIAVLILTIGVKAQRSPYRRIASDWTPGAHGHDRTSTSRRQTKLTRIYITDGYLRDAVDHALRQAAESLESPKCQTLLTEFSDQQGRPLTKRLADLKMSLAEYVVAIIVEDGERYARCRDEVALAFTVVGSRVIHVCGRAFARAAQRDAEEGKAILVHEVLHSLGLGENPPSSRRITYRVKELCW